jgi:hypothetical protein
MEFWHCWCWRRPIYSGTKKREKEIEGNGGGRRIEKERDKGENGEKREERARVRSDLHSNPLCGGSNTAGVVQLCSP